MEIRYYLVKYHETNVLKWQHVEDFCNVMQECLGGHNPEHLPTNRSEDIDEDEFHSKISVSLDKLGCAAKGNWDIVSHPSIICYHRAQMNNS